MDFESLLEYRVLAAFLAFLLVLGTITYHFVEGFAWVNSFYFCVVTLATVGYGDYVPVTTFGKLFTVVYIFAGIGVLVNFATLLGKRVIDKEVALRLKKMENRKYGKIAEE